VRTTEFVESARLTVLEFRVTVPRTLSTMPDSAMSGQREDCLIEPWSRGVK
jgi:hypothetical protein